MNIWRSELNLYVDKIEAALVEEGKAEDINVNAELFQVTVKTSLLQVFEATRRKILDTEETAAWWRLSREDPTAKVRRGVLVDTLLALGEVESDEDVLHKAPNLCKIAAKLAISPPAPLPPQLDIAPFLSAISKLNLIEFPGPGKEYDLKAVKEDPSNSQGFCDLAVSLAPTESVVLDRTVFCKQELFMRAIRLDPTNAFAYRNLAGLLPHTYNAKAVMEEGAPMTRRALLKRAVSNDPQNALGYGMLADTMKPGSHIVLDDGRSMTKAAILKRAIALKPTDARAWFALSCEVEETLLEDSTYMTREDLWKRTISLDPKHTAAREALAAWLPEGGATVLEDGSHTTAAELLRLPRVNTVDMPEETVDEATQTIEIEGEENAAPSSWPLPHPQPAQQYTEEASEPSNPDHSPCSSVHDVVSPQGNPQMVWPTYVPSPVSYMPHVQYPMPQGYGGYAFAESDLQSQGSSMQYTLARENTQCSEQMPAQSSQLPQMQAAQHNGDDASTQPSNLDHSQCSSVASPVEVEERNARIILPRKAVQQTLHNADDEFTRRCKKVIQHARSSSAYYNLAMKMPKNTKTTLLDGSVKTRQQLLEIAIGLDGANSDALLLLATLLRPREVVLLNGKHVSQRGVFTMAIAADLTNSRAYSGLAITLPRNGSTVLECGTSMTQEDLCRKALSLDPSNPDAQELLKRIEETAKFTQEHSCTETRPNRPR